jgi:hypothetical protein
MASSFAAYGDDLNEILSLRKLRDHFAPVIEAVKSEPDFKVAFPESWLA